MKALGETIVGLVIVAAIIGFIASAGSLTQPIWQHIFGVDDINIFLCGMLDALVVLAMLGFLSVIQAIGAEFLRGME